MSDVGELPSLGLISHTNFRGNQRVEHFNECLSDWKWGKPEPEGWTHGGPNEELKVKFTWIVRVGDVERIWR